MVKGTSLWQSFTEMSPNRLMRLILVIAGAVVVCLLLYMARSALFPFLVGGIIAYILFPAVKALERIIPWRNKYPNGARITAITFIYLLALGIFISLLAIIIGPTVSQAGDLLKALPKIYTAAREVIEDLVQELSTVQGISLDIPDAVSTKAEEILSSLGNILANVIISTLTNAIKAVSNTFSFIIGLAIVPVLIFYLLKDGDRLASSGLSVFPESVRVHAREVFRIVNRALGAYIRAQLLLMLFVGLFVFAGLLLLDIQFPILLGIIAGITEAIPVVGPIIGAVPGLIITLATDPGKILWVLLLYLAAQMVENALLVPRIQGKAVNMHPIVIMALLIVASETFGIIGVIVAVPVASVARDVFRYLYGVWSDTPPPEPLEEAIEGVDAGGAQSDT